MCFRMVSKSRTKYIVAPSHTTPILQSSPNANPSRAGANSIATSLPPRVPISKQTGRLDLLGRNNTKSEGAPLFLSDAASRLGEDKPRRGQAVTLEFETRPSFRRFRLWRINFRNEVARGPHRPTQATPGKMKLSKPSL